MIGGGGEGVSRLLGLVDVSLDYSWLFPSTSTTADFFSRL
jgi:hypothetical protein